MWWYEWKRRPTAAERSLLAGKAIRQLRQRGIEPKPVVIDGRRIVHTFWGLAWCEHFESFHADDNRLARGRTYARTGSVCHLDVTEGEIIAIVAGSELYDVSILVDPLPKEKWAALKKRCAGQIGSVVELLQGQLSDEVMKVVTDPLDGLFPRPEEVSAACTCPDWTVMCKHVAAVLYGVGARLDSEPELLFRLRGVDHMELISECVSQEALVPGTTGRSEKLEEVDLSEVFGIELEEEPAEERNGKPARNTAEKKTAKRSREASNGSATSANAKRTTARRLVKTGALKKRSSRRKRASLATAASTAVRKR